MPVPDSKDLKDRLKALGALLRRVVVQALVVLSGVWQLVRPPLLFVLQVVAALVLLFEEWGWQPLVAALGRLARWRPWARLEAWVEALPPYGALAALVLPSAGLFPLKLMAVYLAAQGRVLSAGLVFVAAKIVSTALIGRFFLLTKPRLLEIGWFATIYDLVVPWQEAMFAMIRESWPWRYGRMVKTRVRHEVKQAWIRWRPVLATAWLEISPRLAAASREVRARIASVISLLRG